MCAVPTRKSPSCIQHKPPDTHPFPHARATTTNTQNYNTEIHACPACRPLCLPQCVIPPIRRGAPKSRKTCIQSQIRSYCNLPTARGNRVIETVNSCLILTRLPVLDCSYFQSQAVCGRIRQDQTSKNEREGRQFEGTRRGELERLRLSSKAAIPKVEKVCLQKVLAEMPFGERGLKLETEGPGGKVQQRCTLCSFSINTPGAKIDSENIRTRRVVPGVGGRK
nr:uncharacterized protein LOC124222679 [Neodiprion pinetum]